MIPRRTFLKWSTAAGAVLAPAVTARAASAMPPGVDALLVDTGYGPPPHTAARVLTFAGDVTRVWFEELDPRWRRPGFVLAGITGSDTLFVLQNLARQHGRAIVYQSALGTADARGVTPVSWVIAPIHPSMLA